MRLSSNFLFRLYNRVLNSIAFYPTLITLGLFMLSLAVIVAEYTPWMLSLRDEFSLVLVKNRENARLILGTLVGGTISLTVFNFSMVMVVLNRASANLSPRVIPGLVTQKRHQQILGLYVGTIVYALILMINIGEGDGEGRLPRLGILIGILLGIACLGWFVYFIHSISRAIQVDTVLQGLYEITLSNIEQRAEKQRDVGGAEKGGAASQWPQDESWSDVTATRAGYFKHINRTRLLEILAREEREATLQVHKGCFVVPGTLLLKVRGGLEPGTCQQLRECFLFYVEEYANEHYFFGFKVLSEIAVKSLSPGINDPGTAVKAIDMLSVLFMKYVTLPDFDLDRDQKGVVRLYSRELSFDELLYEVLTPIRTYGRSDPSVMRALLKGLSHVLAVEMSPQRRAVLDTHVRSLVEDLRVDDCNSLDRRMLNDVIAQMNRHFAQDRQIIALS